MQTVIYKQYTVLTESTVTGIAADKLQEYMYAAELVDVSTETLTKSMAKQIKSMKAVQDGTKLSVDAYDRLGVSALNSDGSLRDSEDVYWEIIDALPEIITIVVKAIPQIVGGLVNAIIGNIDKIIIEYFQGAGQVTALSATITGNAKSSLVAFRKIADYLGAPLCAD